MRRLIISLSAATLLLTACGNANMDSTSRDAESKVLTTISSQDISIMTAKELLESSSVTVAEITSLLSGVNDEASARSVASELGKLIPQFQAMQERLGTMDESDFKMSLGFIKATTEFGQAQMGLITEMNRIGQNHPDLGDILTEAFEDIEF